MNGCAPGGRCRPLIGILMLETAFPRIVGDIGHPQTFSFPVLYQRVAGANAGNVVVETDAGLVSAFISAGRSLSRRGVRAIATSCGFLALFHRQLVNALPVPVFSSSLLQVHLAHAVIASGRKIGIITARRQSLTAAHLSGVGILDYPLAIVGMEEAGEFSSVFIGGKTTLDEARCRQEMQVAAQRLVTEHPDVGAIVLECTNMPPYADTVRQTTGLPVFDAVTLVNHAYNVVTSECSG